MKTLEVDGKKHFIYTQEEADERKIAYKEKWRSGQKGDWILTTDNHVMEVLDWGLYGTPTQRKKTAVLKTAFGWTPITLQRLRATKYRFHGRPPEEVIGIRVKGNLRKSYIEKLVSWGTLVRIGKHLIWTDQDIIAAYMATYAEVDPHKALKRGRQIIKQKASREQMSQVARDEALEIGWDERKYVRELERLWKEANEKGSGTSLKVKRIFLRDFGELTGALDKIKEEESKTQIVMLSPDYERLIEGIGRIMSLLEGRRAESEDGEFVIDAEFYEHEILPQFRQLMSHGNNQLTEGEKENGTD